MCIIALVLLSAFSVSRMQDFFMLLLSLVIALVVVEVAMVMVVALMLKRSPNSLETYYITNVCLVASIYYMSDCDCGNW